MSITLKTLKEELKTLARDITETKPLFRGAQRACSKSGYDTISYFEYNKKVTLEMKVEASERGHQHIQLSRFQYNYRHRHIAYCLLRGTPMERIETLPKDGIQINKPNMDYVNQMVAELKPKIEAEVAAYEALRASKEGPQ